MNHNKMNHNKMIKNKIKNYNKKRKKIINQN